MVRLFAWLLAIALAGPWVTSASFAEGADEGARRRARELGYSGVKAYQAGDYSRANVELERAYELLRAPSLGLWSARALSRLGKLVEASQRYVEVSQLPVSAGDPAVQTKARRDAAEDLSALKSKIPSVTFRFEGALASDVELSIDGVPVPKADLGAPLPVNPGAHVVEARRADQRVDAPFEIAEGAKREVVLKFPTEARPSATLQAARATEMGDPAEDTGLGPATASRSSPSSETRNDPTKTLAFVALGVGGASLVFGTITGVLAIGKKNTLDASEDCGNNECELSEKDAVDGYHSLRTLSTVGFWSGIALGATGGVLLLVHSNQAERSQSGGRTGFNVGVHLSPRGAALRGAF